MLLRLVDIVQLDTLRVLKTVDHGVIRRNPAAVRADAAAHDFGSTSSPLQHQASQASVGMERRVRPAATALVPGLQIHAGALRSLTGNPRRDVVDDFRANVNLRA